MAQKEMARRCSRSASIIPNVFDFETPPPGLDDYNRDLRREIGLAADDWLILQPTRVVQRKGIEHAIELVRRLNKEEGTTVVFTTHYLEEAERLCDRITLIDQGVVVADGRLQDMLNDFGKQRVSFTLHKNGVDHVAGAEKIGEDWVVKTENGAVTLAAIANHYTDNLKSARLERATLEEIFLELTHNV